MISEISQKAKQLWQVFITWVKGGKVVNLQSTELPLYFYILPAHNGDTLILQFVGLDGKNHYIWVDGGLVKSYNSYGKKMLQAINQRGEQIDLMVVTHVDQDHIGGILAFANDPDIPKSLVKKIWFNSSKILSVFFNSLHLVSREVEMPLEEGTRSIAQGMRLEDYLEKSGSWHSEPIMRFQSFDMHGASLSVLAPDAPALRALNDRWEEAEQTDRSLDNDYDQPLAVLANRGEREDQSVANGSSICFVFECRGRRILLLGDAHPSTVSDSLRQLGYSAQEPLKLDAVKLSHHGSKASISRELLTLLEANTYVISTDGSRHNLPNKEALARIILHPKRDPSQKLQFVFNYGNALLRSIFSEEEMQQYNFSCTFPEEGKEGNMLVWGKQGSPPK